MHSLDCHRGTNKNNKLSKGEICVANVIPPANGASQGKNSKNGCFWGKNGLTKTAAAPKPANFFWNGFDFLFMRDEVKKLRKNSFSGSRMTKELLPICLTPYTGGIFLQVKFATSLLALSTGGLSFSPTFYFNIWKWWNIC